MGVDLWASTGSIKNRQSLDSLNATAMKQPQPPPPKPPSTTKKDNTKKRKSVQKQTKKKKTKKTDNSALPTPKLHDANGNAVVMQGNYMPQRLYSYEVQYKDNSHPKYTPFVWKDEF